MAKIRPTGKKQRLVRMLRLLQRIRPAEQPATYRRNLVALHPSGPEFFAALFAAIRVARHSILLEYYIIHNDTTGRRLADELVAAVRRGLRVLLIYDYIGCIDTPSAYFRDLADQGVELIPFNVISLRRGIHLFDKRDHRKMTIIDGHLGFLGGFNIGDEYAGLAPISRNFRDMGFTVYGSAVTELERIFLETWRMEHDEPPRLPSGQGADYTSVHSGQANVVIVSGSPHHRRSYIRSAFLAAITSATEEIIIATPYLVPGPRIVRSLLRAVRRGVRVRLLLPASCDVPLVRIMGQSYYSALLAGGIEIYELEREFLHAKVMLIDGERTVLGSANLDQRSFHRNFEINAVIDSAQFGGEIRLILERDLADAGRVSLEAHERRGLLARLLERLVKLFGWFL